MDLQLREKVAIVTGASKRIGRAIATRLAEEGATLAICARGETALKEAEQELRSKGVNVLAAPCDVTSADAFDHFLEAVHQSFGRVDILVNNAGAIPIRDDESGWRLGFDGGIMPAVRACWKVAPWMTAQGSGAIVHISSVSGLEAGSPPAYAAAKAALISHSKTLAVALAAQHVRVNVVAVGSIEAPGGIWDQIRRTNRPLYDRVLASIPSGRLGTPDEVADAVTFLASPRASWITGACVAVDGAQHRGNL